MYVHLEVLAACESLEWLGSDPRDQIVLRAGLPPSPRSKTAVPVKIMAAPIMGQQMGIALAPDVVKDMQHEFTKRAKHRALEKYLLRFQVTLQGRWVGTIFVQLMCLVNGYVVQRWVHMHPVKDFPLGSLLIRVVMRETEEEALAAFRQDESAEPSELTRSEGCTCDLCDPYHELLDEATKRERLEKNERAPMGCAVM